MEETRYLDLIRHVTRTATPRVTRGGAVTLSSFGHRLEFDLRTGFPILTTKKVFFKGVVEELLWMLRGHTDSNLLSRTGVRIWEGHTSREHLDHSGLQRNRVGDAGPIYGFQWRHYGARYDGCDEEYTGQGVDQLKRLIEGIREDPYGRRHVVSAWNPGDLKLMALPPCHMLVQFYVEDSGELSAMMTQRSGDVGLGVPFNIVSYSLLLTLIAACVGRKPARLVYSLGDAHIYEDHVEPLVEQAKLQPHEKPSITITGIPEDIAHMPTESAIKALEDLKFENFVLNNYVHHPPIKMKMVV